MRKNAKKKKKLLYFIIILIVLLIVSIIALQRNIEKKKNESSKEEETISYYEDTSIDKLNGLSELERIKFYFSQYMDAIEDNDYEKAYSYLYDEFKQNYFPELSDFEKYAKRKYPDIIVLNYDDIEVEGYYYIFKVTFSDVINNTSFTQRFVIREYDFNKVVLSFQAE